ncbi:MAG: hypothetical protein ACYTBJ_17550 [Planctomycetota bacterium]|jgi:hypothetical protein
MIGDMTTCARCARQMPVEGADACHECGALLCWRCYDDYGHCGHSDIFAKECVDRARKPRGRTPSIMKRGTYLGKPMKRC